MRCCFSSTRVQVCCRLTAHSLMLVRRAGKPAILVANKSEGRAGDAGAYEAYGLGLGEPVALSAEHGEGLADLYDGPASRAA